MGSRPTAARVSPLRAKTNGQGQYVGACGCTFHVQDDARVLYFDDPVLADIVARTDPCCGTLRRCLCGGRGQAVRVQSRTCRGGCVRTRGLGPLPCIPTCCVCLCGPAALRYDMPAKVGTKRARTCVVRFQEIVWRAIVRGRTWAMGEKAVAADQIVCREVATIFPNLNSA